MHAGMSGNITLHPYQAQAVRFALDAFRRHGGAGLFLDMGLGKTLTTIAILDVLHAQYPEARFLIVAPKTVALHTWPDELEKFSSMHDLDWAVACTQSSNPRKRREALDRNATVTIINQENIAWLDRNMRDWPWTGIVIDELTGFKDPGSKRFRILKRRRKDLRWTLGLTGTPAAKGLMDLWAQCHLLDGGAALGRTIAQYRSRWFTATRMNAQHQVIEWTAKDEAYGQIMHAIEPFCLTMLAKDKLPGLPEKTVIDHWLDMPKRTRIHYEQLREELVAYLKGQEVTAANMAVATNKLSQLTAGLLYPDTGPDGHPSGPALRLDDVKMDELERIVERAGGQPILVFYQYRDEMDRLKERFPAVRDVREPGVVDQWNQGGIPLLATHPASARFGLNLQKGGHIIVWLSLTWSLEDWMQANARLLRQGQSMPVQIHRLLESDTIDARKTDVLAGRARLQDAVMGELKHADA